ncbi:dihydrofolate reductase family protein [Brachybacterium paraconglomeratum]|uniref:dihydrofolate reductase family protein n=1 Tax=Brachybacterium paraconglomeratum TaxID=173362 RepID=UPI00026C753A|nr:dihydrofolate reductase family protein [Brachybacterium paraconglomeratum]
MTQSVRVQNFGVSRDGIGAGEDQTLEQPFGHVDPMALLGWGFATASFPSHEPGVGTRGFEDRLTRDFDHGIGVEIMGRHKFGHQRGPWTDDGWIGWWGEEPPFHTPVVVLTHYEREPLVVGETTFHFVNASPAEALARAKELAGGLDVRIGGGVTTVREFLDADLIDELHVSIAPVEYGHGLRLWERPEELEDRFHLEKVMAPSGVEHCFLWRR